MSCVQQVVEATKPKPPARVTYSNRLLYAAIPSTMYAKNDKTIDTLMEALVTDFCSLYQHGFRVPHP